MKKMNICFNLRLKVFAAGIIISGLMPLLASSQNGMSINSTGAPADNSAMLDVSSSSRGMLIPRVSLQSTTDVTTIANPALSLLVYNTNASMTGGGVGFWYFNGSSWEKLAASAPSGNGWLINGNSGTSPGTNFIGTLDNKDFIVKTNGNGAANERIRFFSGGKIVVNNTTASVRDIFSVYGDGTTGAINALGTVAITGYSSVNNIGVLGENNATGIGVRGNNSSDGYGVVGINSGSGTGSGVYGGANSSQSIGVYGANNSTGPGVIATSKGMIALQASSSISNPNATAIYGISQGNGVLGAANGLLTCQVPTPQSCGTAGSGKNFGIYGTAVSTTTGTIRAGGYFASGANTANPPVFSNYVYTGAITAANLPRKVEGPGTVNTVVKDVNDSLITLTCPEAPEILFEDYGIGKLVNGESHISIDPNFSKNITVDDRHPLKVFIQLEGECNGVYVINKSSKGFDVKELNNGKSDINFSWHIVANRANEKLTDGTIAPYADQRFSKAMPPQKSLSVPVFKVNENNLVK